MKRIIRNKLILLSISLGILAICSILVFFPKKENITSSIPGVIPWSGIDPYPRVDWSHTQDGLQQAVTNFEHVWGSKLTILQAYRPKEYTDHIRSVWEVWRYVHGKSYTSGYGCDQYTHIDTAKLKTVSVAQRDLLEQEARRHGFTNGGDTPPACKSDHSLGIAIDIAPPLEPKLYTQWILVGNSVGLCHYIRGDEPHFGLISSLPASTNCLTQ